MSRISAVSAVVEPRGVEPLTSAVRLQSIAHSPSDAALFAGGKMVFEPRTDGDLRYQCDTKPDAADTFDRYALLTEQQWAYVIGLLTWDLEEDCRGIRFVAPDGADDERETAVFFELQTRGMNWTGDTQGRSLSRAIIDDNRRDIDELRRAAASLDITKAALLSHVRFLSTPTVQREGE